MMLTTWPSSAADRLRIRNAPACCSSSSQTTLSPAFASRFTCSTTSCMSWASAVARVAMFRFTDGLPWPPATNGPFGASKEQSLM